MCLTTSGLHVYGNSPLVVICIVLLLLLLLLLLLILLLLFVSRPMNQIYEDVIGVTRSL